MKISPDNLKEKTCNHIDTESLLAKRKLRSKEEDSTPWLITFADLMTILLVFTFVLFITNMKNGTSDIVKKYTEPKSNSLITLAHADLNETKNNVTVPVFVDNNQIKRPEPETRERIILKKHLRFSSKSDELRDNHIIELKKFAELSTNNRDSKIIIGISKENNNSLLTNAVRIVDHLANTEGINKSRMYIQTASSITLPDKYSEIPIDNILEIKLVKSFWWF